MKLFLIDGHALIFKMYYAFLGRPMVNSKGEDTSILFGFTKYLLELIEREKPSHIAVAFDPPGGTFRNQLYPEYKANRAETPQLVIDQVVDKQIDKLFDQKKLYKAGFFAGLKTEEGYASFCVTEKRSKEEIDTLVHEILR